MNTTLILNNGFHYSGKILEETDTHILLDDWKLGPIKITKAAIMVRNDKGAAVP